MTTEVSVVNPFAASAAPKSAAGGLVSVEQQRAIAEVQARMMIARANPRDQRRCMDVILTDCQRPTLAEHAVYEYSRGGSDISGPSIRLAEAIARVWGNVACGIKEVSRSDGASECVAYAWDLESGYYDERQFQVRHWRDTKKGGYKLTDERDIYELIANMGQRRKRAVLLSVIPGDVVQAAVEQCEETMKARADTSPDALAKMVATFEAIGVTRAQIERRIQRRLDAITPGQIVGLRKIYNSIRDGMSAPAEWFDADVVIEQPTAKPSAAPTPEPQQPTAKTTPQQQTAEAGQPAAAEPAPPTPSDAGPPSSAGQRKVVRAKMEVATLTEKDMVAKFGFGVDAMPAVAVNDVLSWIANPV